jgi:hypothetical protein
MPGDTLSQTIGTISAVFTPGSAAFERVQMAAGMAGKDTAYEVVKAALGPDGAMRNFKSGKVRLRANFDLESNGDVIMKLRPKGAWVLADAGRKNRGDIFRIAWKEKRSRHGNVRMVRDRRAFGGRTGIAVMTPRGPRAKSSFGPSRGLKVVARTAKRAEANLIEAAGDAIVLEVAKAVR